MGRVPGEEEPRLQYATGQRPDEGSTLADKESAAKLTKGYADHQAKWTDDLNQVEANAREEREKVKDFEGRGCRRGRADSFDLAEALLEIGLVITSVTLLTRSRIYWYLGLVFSALGVASVVSAFLLK